MAHLQLGSLLGAIGFRTVPGGADERAITGIAYDSRTVTAGSLFVAVSGFHVDGAMFVAEAAARGAVAAVVNREAVVSASIDPSLCIIRVPDTRTALAALAAAWYGYPARQLRTVGVTGTDGKTTTSYLLSAVLAPAAATGLFSTVAYKIGDLWEINDSRQSTPEALEVQWLLRRMVDAGVGYAVLESTSHGLDLHKLDYCEYDVAVLTNMSPDHLDYHGSFAAYREAKSRLFAMLDTSVAKGTVKTAVLNADDPSAAFMASRTRARRISYAIDAPADVRVQRLELGAGGTSLEAATPAGPLVTWLPMPGRFNVYNALAAAAVGISQGISVGAIAGALSTATGVPGRMQRIEAGQPFTVIVDYAHTAASFEKVLEMLRPLTAGRLIAVFGCAGERGAERRAGMGGVAARLADYAVLTTEDPRNEDPAAIIAQIAAAMAAAGAVEGRRFERVLDRREAIARAFALADPGDVVLLAGKGHEHSIEVARGRVPWDEAAVARALLVPRSGAALPARGESCPL